VRISGSVVLGTSSSSLVAPVQPQASPEPSKKAVKTEEKKPRPVEDLDLMNDDYLKPPKLKSSLRTPASEKSGSSGSGSGNNSINNSGNPSNKGVHFGKKKENLSFGSTGSSPSSSSSSSSPSRRTQSVSYESTEDIVKISSDRSNSSGSSSPPWAKATTTTTTTTTTTAISKEKQEDPQSLVI